jgi:hypothetical protein
VLSETVADGVNDDWEWLKQSLAEVGGEALWTGLVAVVVV